MSGLGRNPARVARQFGSGWLELLLEINFWIAVDRPQSARETCRRGKSAFERSETTLRASERLFVPIAVHGRINRGQDAKILVIFLCPPPILAVVVQLKSELVFIFQLFSVITTTVRRAVSRFKRPSERLLDDRPSRFQAVGIQPEKFLRAHVGSFLVQGTQNEGCFSALPIESKSLKFTGRPARPLN